MKNDLLFIIRGSKFLSLVKMTNYDKIHRVRFTRVFNPHQSWISCKRKDFNLSKSHHPSASVHIPNDIFSLTAFTSENEFRSQTQHFDIH